MRIWVTRDEQSEGPLSNALRAAGLTVVLEPVMERRVVDDAADAIARLGRDDWLVLTSVFAIEAVAPELARIPRVAVVGQASRRAAQRRGFRVELVSVGGDADSLFEELRAEVSRGAVASPPCGGRSGQRPPQRAAATKVCYPRSSLVTAPDPWPGIELLSPIVYETRTVGFDRTVINRVDVVAVASPSAVRAVGPTFQSASRPVDLPFASIGPLTSAALREMGIEPWVEAPKRSFESLASAIAAHAGQ